MRKENVELVIGSLALILLFLCSVLMFKLYMLIQGIFDPIKLAVAASVAFASMIGLAYYHSKRFDDEGHEN